MLKSSLYLDLENQNISVIEEQIIVTHCLGVIEKKTAVANWKIKNENTASRYAKRGYLLFHSPQGKNFADDDLIKLILLDLKVFDEFILVSGDKKLVEEFWQIENKILIWYNLKEKMIKTKLNQSIIEIKT